MVCRVEHRENFTIVTNSFLRDNKLSMKAKGLLTTMLSMPETWHYTVRGLAAVTKEGTAAISSGLRELEYYGYLTRRQNRGNDGRISDSVYTIFESPKGIMFPDTVKTVESVDSEEPDVKMYVTPPPVEYVEQDSVLSVELPVSKDTSEDTPKYMPKDTSVSETHVTQTVADVTPVSNVPTIVPTMAEILDSDASLRWAFGEDVLFPSVLSNPDTSKSDAERQNCDTCDTPSPSMHSVVTVEEDEAEEADATCVDLEETIKSVITSNPANEMRKMSKNGNWTVDDWKGKFCDQVGVERLKAENPGMADIIDCAINFMAESCGSKYQNVRIGKSTFEREQVRQRFSAISAEDFNAVLDALPQLETIRNKRAYILTALYNAPTNPAKSDLWGDRGDQRFMTLGEPKKGKNLRFMTVDEMNDRFVEYAEELKYQDGFV